VPKIGESFLKKRLGDYLRANLPDAVIFRHEDHFTAGIPDFSITCNGATSWIEAKVITDAHGFMAKKIQTLNMVKLNDQGHAFYVVWDSSDKQSRTAIVEPRLVWRHVSRGTLEKLTSEFTWISGFNHAAVFDTIKEYHS
jgi:hypothetical protein